MLKLQFSGRAAKSLEKLIKNAPEIARVIAAQIEKLSVNSTPENSIRIVGYSCHRARVGSYRIIYEFNRHTL